MGTNLSPLDQERLSAWMDGELSPAEAQAVARLVETDPDWTEAHRQLQSLNRVLEVWDVPAPAEDLADRVLAHARYKPEHVVLRVGRWVLSAAAVALIAVGAWQFLTKDYTRPVDPHPNYTRGTLAGVPETFVRDNASLLHNMPENIPAKGPVKIVIAPASGSANQPAGKVLYWNQLTPQQQQAVRQRAVIFLRLTPQQQAKLLRAHERAMRSAKLQQQMSWLKPVLESLTPQERTQLQTMSPAQRGEMFLERRNELIRSGKLIPETTDADTSSLLVSPSSKSLVSPSRDP